MHKILFYNKNILCLYMFRVDVLIIRSSKLYYTPSGIITFIGGRLVQMQANKCCVCMCVCVCVRAPMPILFHLV